jgi:hypothetical protein
MKKLTASQIVDVLNRAMVSDAVDVLNGVLSASTDPKFKPCPQCGGEMTRYKAAGTTMRGSIRCLGCSFQCASMGRLLSASDEGPTDHSTNDVVVEYAMQVLIKGKKSPKVAAMTTMKKLNGGTNMMIDPHAKAINIDPRKLEDAIWGRLADMTKRAISKFDWTAEDAAKSTLQNFYGWEDMEATEKKYLGPLLKAVQHGVKS